MARVPLRRLACASCMRGQFRLTRLNKWQREKQMNKALWVVSFNTGDFDRLLDHASESGVKLLCIRTTSTALPKAIAEFGKHGIRVYGWRWPAVTAGSHSAPHYFALDEAAYVVKTLLAAGLAGYIVDPESDGPGQADDWNDAKHAALARDFCAQIRQAAPPISTSVSRRAASIRPITVASLGRNSSALPMHCIRRPIGERVPSLSTEELRRRHFSAASRPVQVCARQADRRDRG